MKEKMLNFNNKKLIYLFIFSSTQIIIINYTNNYFGPPK